MVSQLTLAFPGVFKSAVYAREATTGNTSAHAGYKLCESILFNTFNSVVFAESLMVEPVFELIVWPKPPSNSLSLKVLEPAEVAVLA